MLEGFRAYAFTILYLYLEGQLSTNFRCITPPSILIPVIDRYPVLLIRFESVIHKFLYSIFPQGLPKHLRVRKLHSFPQFWFSHINSNIKHWLIIIRPYQTFHVILNKWFKSIIDFHTCIFPCIIHLWSIITCCITTMLGINSYYITHLWGYSVPSSIPPHSILCIWPNILIPEYIIIKIWPLKPFS